MVVELTPEPPSEPSRPRPRGRGRSGDIAAMMLERSRAARFDEDDPNDSFTKGQRSLDIFKIAVTEAVARALEKLADSLPSGHDDALAAAQEAIIFGATMAASDLNEDQIIKRRAVRRSSDAAASLKLENSRVAADVGLQHQQINLNRQLDEVTRTAEAKVAEMEAEKEAAVQALQKGEATGHKARAAFLTQMLVKKEEELEKEKAVVARYRSAPGEAMRLAELARLNGRLEELAQEKKDAAADYVARVDEQELVGTLLTEVVYASKKGAGESQTKGGKAFYPGDPTECKRLCQRLVTRLGETEVEAAKAQDEHDKAAELVRLAEEAVMSDEPSTPPPPPPLAPSMHYRSALQLLGRMVEDVSALCSTQLDLQATLSHERAEHVASVELAQRQKEEVAAAHESRLAAVQAELEEKSAEVHNLWLRYRCHEQLTQSLELHVQSLTTKLAAGHDAILAATTKFHELNGKAAAAKSAPAPKLPVPKSKRKPKSGGSNKTDKTGVSFDGDGTNGEEADPNRPKTEAELKASVDTSKLSNALGGDKEKKEEMAPIDEEVEVLLDVFKQHVLYMSRIAEDKGKKTVRDELGPKLAAAKKALEDSDADAGVRTARVAAELQECRDAEQKALNELSELRNGVVSSLAIVPHNMLPPPKRPATGAPSIDGPEEAQRVHRLAESYLGCHHLLHATARELKQAQAAHQEAQRSLQASFDADIDASEARRAHEAEAARAHRARLVKAALTSLGQLYAHLSRSLSGVLGGVRTHPSLIDVAPILTVGTDKLSPFKNDVPFAQLRMTLGQSGGAQHVEMYQRTKLPPAVAQRPGTASPRQPVTVRPVSAAVTATSAAVTAPRAASASAR